MILNSVLNLANKKELLAMVEISNWSICYRIHIINSISLQVVQIEIEMN
jgi:hypothetical protein